MQLALLSQRYRVAVTLYYREDLSDAEIDEVLNQPIGTLQAHGHRALRKLHTALETQTDGVR